MPRQLPKKADNPARGTDPRHELGRHGEAQAAAYLESLGYHILERNYRAGRIEIDLICLAPPGGANHQREEIVFVEVKTRRGFGTTTPEEAVDGFKQARLCRAAATYLLRNRMDALYPRFDVIAIECSPSGSSLRHIESAFWVGG